MFTVKKTLEVAGVNPKWAGIMATNWVATTNIEGYALSLLGCVFWHKLSASFSFSLHWICNASSLEVGEWVA